MKIDKNYIQQIAKKLYFTLDDVQSSYVLENIIAFPIIKFSKISWQNQITTTKNISLREDVSNHTNLDVLKDVVTINKYIVGK